MTSTEILFFMCVLFRRYFHCESNGQKSKKKKTTLVIVGLQNFQNGSYYKQFFESLL